MKPVFQIAGGIVLAFLIIMTIIDVYQQYRLDQAAIVLKNQAEQRQAELNEKQKNAAVLEQKRQILLEMELKRKVALQKEQAKKIAEERAKRLLIKQQTDAAWNKYYEKPYNCNRPESQNEINWCNRHYVNARNTFETLLRDGKIAIE